jgi:hypothetical protein
MGLNVSHARETSHKIRSCRPHRTRIHSSGNKPTGYPKERRRILTNAPLKAIKLNDLLVNYWVTCTR